MLKCIKVHLNKYHRSMKRSHRGYHTLITLFLLLQFSKSSTGLTTFQWTRYTHLTDGMMGKALYEKMLKTRIKCASECMKNAQCKYMGYNKNTNQCKGYQETSSEDMFANNSGLDIWGKACQSGFRMVGGMCIKMDLQKTKMSDGQSICQSLNSRLAVLDTQQKIDDVSEHVLSLLHDTHLYWVGGTRALKVLESSPWEWSTGERVDTSLIVNDMLTSTISCLTVDVAVRKLKPIWCLTEWHKPAILCEEVL